MKKNLRREIFVFKTRNNNKRGEVYFFLNNTSEKSMFRVIFYVIFVVEYVCLILQLNIFQVSSPPTCFHYVTTLTLSAFKCNMF